MMKHQSAQLDDAAERRSFINAMVKVIRGEPGVYIKNGKRYIMRPQKPPGLETRRAIK